jgi:acetyl esterase/lipase
MTEILVLERDLISGGREPSDRERFYYRALRSYVYKSTPQVDLEIHVHFPHDWCVTDRRPAVVFFFGGGLQGGTIEQFTRQAAYLAGRGMIVARAAYRLIPEHDVTAGHCVADAKSAIRWMRTHADELGMDSDCIVAAGGSSGGFLAAATGILPGFDEPDEVGSISSQPNLMVLYNPAFELHSHVATTAPAFSEDLEGIDPNCFAPTETLAQQLHNATHLSVDVPPMWVWYGSTDKFYRLAQVFLTRARELGCAMILQVTEGADHGYFNDYLSVYQETLAGMTRFLEAQGYLD